jgi:hypothetical protein
MKIHLLVFSLGIIITQGNKILSMVLSRASKIQQHPITHFLVLAQGTLTQQVLKMLSSDRSLVFTTRQVTIPY